VRFPWPPRVGDLIRARLDDGPWLYFNVRAINSNSLTVVDRQHWNEPVELERETVEDLYGRGLLEVAPRT
jgi:hypothetical protein